MGLGVQVAGSSGGAPGHQAVVVGASVSIDGTLFDQAVVVTLDGVLNDGGKGGGLIGSLAELLNGGHQFHRVLTQADAELLWSVGMVVCHCCWDGSGEVWQGHWLISGLISPPSSECILSTNFKFCKLHVCKICLCGRWH